MELNNGYACSANILTGFWSNTESLLEAEYQQAMAFANKIVMALVSKTDERAAFDFLLRKGWKDLGRYSGNSNHEMHLLVHGPFHPESKVIAKLKSLRPSKRGLKTRTRKRP